MGTLRLLQRYIKSTAPDESLPWLESPDVLPKLHRRSQLLFEELLDRRAANGVVAVSLRDLSEVLPYSHTSIGFAFKELHRVNLVKRISKGCGHAPSIYFINWGFHPYNPGIDLRKRENPKPRKYGVSSFSVNPDNSKSQDSTKGLYSVFDPDRSEERFHQKDKEGPSTEHENDRIPNRKDKRDLCFRVRAALPDHQRGLANAVCDLVWHHRHTTFGSWLRVIAALEGGIGDGLDGWVLDRGAVWHVRRAVKKVCGDSGDVPFAQWVWENRLGDKRAFLLRGLEILKLREAGRDKKAAWFVEQVTEMEQCPHCGFPLTKERIAFHYCWKRYDALRVELEKKRAELDKELATLSTLPSLAARSNDFKGLSAEDFLRITGEYLACERLGEEGL